jgi:hypothetical protein
MSTDVDLVADQILQRLQLSMLPTPADEARNAGAIEARLRLPQGALQLGPQAPAGAPAATGGPGALEAPPPAESAASLAAAGGLPLATQLGVLLVFGAATGVGGYLWGRSDSEPRHVQPVAVEVAAVQLAPSAAVSAPAASAIESSPPLAASEPAALPAPLPAELRKRVPERRAVRAAPRAVAAASAPRSETPTLGEALTPSEALTLAEALELLRNAEAAVRNSDGLQARMLLGDLDRRAPAGMLLEERLVTLVLAACALGDEPAAREASSRLQQVNPESLYRARLESSCVAAEKRAR